MVDLTDRVWDWDRIEHDVVMRIRALRVVHDEYAGGPQHNDLMKALARVLAPLAHFVTMVDVVPLQDDNSNGR